MRHKYLRESSRLNSGLSKHLIESCNKFLNEDEEEEVFVDPNQEDMFGKSGRDDKPRKGKEFSKKRDIEIGGSLLGSTASDFGMSEAELINYLESVIPKNIKYARIDFDDRNFIADLKDEENNEIRILQDGEFNMYGGPYDPVFDRPEVSRVSGDSDDLEPEDISDLYVKILDDGMKSYSSFMNTAVEQNGSFPFIRGDDIFNLKSVLKKLGLKV